MPGADVEDWGTLLLTFDDGTVAQMTGGDTTLGGIRNQLAVYAARAVVLCNINPNDALRRHVLIISEEMQRHRGGLPFGTAPRTDLDLLAELSRLTLLGR